MTAEHDEQLERTLTELTTWHGPVPRLWRRALGMVRSGPAQTPSRFHRLLRRPLSDGVAASIVIIALGITIVVNLPHLGARHDALQQTRRAPVAHRSLGVEARETLVAEADATAQDADSEFLRGLTSLGYVGGDEMTAAGAYAAPGGGGSGMARWFGRVFPTGRGMGGGFGRGAAVRTAGGVPAIFANEADETVTMEPRHIVRKATIELATNDVRAAFLKAAMVISEADGEYVQESSLTGSGDTAQANLTLRVAADRLSKIMNDLRDLGVVRSEQVTGQDVTTQAVDLEARLRNEQRVEVELLELLEKRKDAPLTEILQLRATLSDVRNVIERLTAQRQRLSRLVSLATVLIIIRAEKAPPDEPAEFSIGAYFSKGVQNAWRKGLMLLADTCGFLLSVIVGGLIWWVLLVLVFNAIWRHRRRAAASTTKS